MTEMTRRLLLAGTAAAPFAGWVRLADAATPKDTVVFASRSTTSSPSIRARPTRSSGADLVSNVYDRLVRYEAEDLTQAGRRRRRELDGLARRQDLHLQAAPEPEVRERRAGDGGRHGLLAAAGRPARQDAGLPVHPARLEQGQRQGPRSQRPTRRPLKFTITENFAPSLVLNLMATVAASVVEKKVALANEINGDLGNAWLKTHSATSGALQADLVEGQRKSVSLEANPGYPSRRAAHEARDRPPRARAGTQRLLLEKGDIDIALRPAPDQLKPLAEQQGHQDRVASRFRHLVHAR